MREKSKAVERPASRADADTVSRDSHDSLRDSWVADLALPFPVERDGRGFVWTLLRCSSFPYRY